MQKNIMNITIATVVVISLTGIGFIQLQDPPSANEQAEETLRELQDGTSDQHQDNHGEDSIHDRMEGVQECVRGLFRSAGDPEKQAESLEFITQLQEHILAAKQLEPDSAANVPVEERQEFLLDYRKHMAEFLREVTEVEMEIIAGEHDAAMTRIRDNLVQIRDESHEEFAPGEDDGNSMD